MMPMVEFGVCPTLEVADSAWIVPSRLEMAGVQGESVNCIPWEVHGDMDMTWILHGYY